jgi:hypothetical protein
VKKFQPHNLSVEAIASNDITDETTIIFEFLTHFVTSSCDGNYLHPPKIKNYLAMLAINI